MNTDWSNKHGAIWWTTKEKGVENFWHIRKAIMLIVFNSGWPKGLWVMYAFIISMGDAWDPRWLIHRSSIPFLVTIARSVRSSQYVCKGSCMLREYCSELTCDNCENAKHLPLGSNWKLFEYFCFPDITCLHGSNNNKTASATLVIIYWTCIMHQAFLTNTVLWYLF